MPTGDWNDELEAAFHEAHEGVQGEPAAGNLVTQGRQDHDATSGNAPVLPDLTDANRIRRLNNGRR